MNTFQESKNKYIRYKQFKTEVETHAVTLGISPEVILYALTPSVMRSIKEVARWVESDEFIFHWERSKKRGKK